MISRIFFHILAILFVSMALYITAIEYVRNDMIEAQKLPLLPGLPFEPKAEALRHCQELGTAAATNSECLKTWAEERDRFLKIVPRSDLLEKPVSSETTP